MSDHRHPRRVEDFTLPFLVSAFFVTWMTLGTLWTVVGFVPTLILAWLCDRALTLGLARVRADDERRQH